MFEKLKGEDKDEYLRPGCVGEEGENDNEDDEDEEEEDKKDFIFEN